MEKLHAHLCSSSASYHRWHKGKGHLAIHGAVLVFFGYAVLALLSSSISTEVPVYGQAWVRDVVAAEAQPQGRFGALTPVPIEIEHGLADVTDNPLWFLMGHAFAIWNIY